MNDVAIAEAAPDFKPVELLNAALAVIAKRLDIDQRSAFQVVLSEAKDIDARTEAAISSAEIWLWSMRRCNQAWGQLNKSLDETRKPKIDSWTEKARKYLF